MISRSIRKRIAGGGAFAFACCAAGQAQAQAYGESANLTTMLLAYAAIAAVAILIYLIPTFVAFSRKHPNRWIIAVINVALGGTVIGWFGALVWAMSAAHLSATGSNGGESGLNIFANDPVTVRIARDAEPVMSPGRVSPVEPLLAPDASSTPTTATAKGKGDMIGQLERLAALRAAGDLSDEEFASMKSTLMARQA